MWAEPATLLLSTYMWSSYFVQKNSIAFDLSLISSLKMVLATNKDRYRLKFGSYFTSSVPAVSIFLFVFITLTRRFMKLKCAAPPPLLGLFTNAIQASVSSMTSSPQHNWEWEVLALV